MNLIAPQLRKGQLIILESTYPGTTREKICEKLNSKFNLGNKIFCGLFIRKN